MDTIKPYSRRSFVIIIMIMVLLIGMLAATIYYGSTHITQVMTRMVTPEMTAAELLAQVNQLHDTYALYLISSLAGALILSGLLLWLVLRRVAKGVLKPPQTSSPSGKNKTKASDPKKDDRQSLQNQRIFLHLLVVLQREGRLVDFLQENLDLYEDEQVGAAVRNIHNSCRKIIEKNLSMEPVISGNEGEEITVAPGFDPDAIRLTGHVTGEPPFKGLLRHKGWRAQKLELPDLSAAKDPTIISPAEVEIE